MSIPVTPAMRQVMLSVITRTPTGATFDDIASALSPRPDDRDVKEALNALADAGLIVSDGSGRNARFISLLPPGQTGAAPAPASTPAMREPAVVTAGTPAVAADAFAPVAVADDPDFNGMFELAAPMIITTALTRSATTTSLRAQAMRNRKVGPAMASYVHYATRRLETLTAQDVAIYGITAAEFARWQASFHPTNTPRADTVPASTTTPATPAAQVDAPVAACTPAATPVAAATPTPPAAPSRPAAAVDAVKLLENVRVDHLLDRAVALLKSMLTLQRLSVAIVWAIGLRMFAYRVLPLGGLAFLIIIPVAGLPWVFFRWRDAARNSSPLNGREAAMLLLAGGYASLVVANLLMSAGMMIRGTIG